MVGASRVSPLLSELGVVCPRCAALNAPRTDKCMECGASADPQDSASDAPPGMRPARASPAEPQPSAPVRPSPPPPVVPTGPRTPPAPRPSPASSRFILNVVAGSSKGQRFRLLAAGCGVGREHGAIQFKDDPT